MNLFRFHPKNENVISTEATDSLIVRCAVERSLYFRTCRCFCFRTCCRTCTCCCKFYVVILTLSNVGWGGTAHFVFAVAWFSSGQSYQSAAPTTSRIPPSLPSKNVVNPNSSVRYSRVRASPIRSTTSYRGCPNVFPLPTETTASFGAAARKNSGVVEVRLPWCPTFSRVTGAILP